MKFIPIALLLISTPLWAANSTNTNVLTVKAELVTGSCDITASDVDLGDLDASEFAAGGAWANLSATTKGNVPTQPLKISFRCDSGSRQNAGVELCRKKRNSPVIRYSRMNIPVR